jgi:hypothetical protein
MLLGTKNGIVSQMQAGTNSMHATGASGYARTMTALDSRI